MAKKHAYPRLSESQLYNPAAAEPLTSAESRERDLAEEYRYVITDLRKIGILALVMLTLLIVLAFILV